MPASQVSDHAACKLLGMHVKAWVWRVAHVHILNHLEPHKQVFQQVGDNMETAMAAASLSAWSMTCSVRHGNPDDLTSVQNSITSRSSSVSIWEITGWLWSVCAQNLGMSFVQSEQNQQQVRTARHGSNSKSSNSNTLMIAFRLLNTGLRFLLNSCSTSSTLSLASSLICSGRHGVLGQQPAGCTSDRPLASCRTFSSSVCIVSSF